MWEERLKPEFEKRFVGKILNGKRAGQYDWDKQEIESWEWFCKAINPLLKEQREICANSIKDMNYTLAEIVRLAPPPEGEVK